MAEKTAPTEKDLARFAQLVLDRLAAEGARLTNISTSRNTDIIDKLNAKPRLTVPFPRCASDMLALINSKAMDAQGNGDEVATIFREYFNFVKHGHITLGVAGDGQDLRKQLRGVIDESLAGCSGEVPLIPPDPNYRESVIDWPSECCLCAPCVTLDGNRPKPELNEPENSLKRLFVGDVLWLFYVDRLGINQIIGAILDAYAYTGKFPISDGSMDGGIKDDLVALVLEIMVREVKTGSSSTVRDRNCVYRRSLGWTLDAGRKLKIESEVNDGFDTLFHKFICLALEFYRDKRLADAIHGTQYVRAGGNVSQATLTAIGETVDLLKKRFDPFHYGRNYYNTLNGLVWSIASLSVVRELANTLGIPSAQRALHYIIPAAYDVLVLKRPISTGEANRFTIHMDCATNGRDILLDMEVVDYTNTDLLTHWINTIESKVESYRSAYRAMTNVDLGMKTPPPTIEQRA